MRQYAYLAWLFEYPVDYQHCTFSFRHSGHARKVEKALVEKGLVKIVEYNRRLYKLYLVEYKEGKITKEELKDYKEGCFQNTEKVWAYRQWMTHEEIVSRNQDQHRISTRHSTNKDRVIYPSLTEEGVVAVLRKFGLKADSKLEVYAPQPYVPKASHRAKWRVEWKEATDI
jgi:hypothetical protein